MAAGISKSPCKPHLKKSRPTFYVPRRRPNHAISQGTIVSRYSWGLSQAIKSSNTTSPVTALGSQRSNLKTHWLDPVIGPTTRERIRCPRRCGDCHETLEDAATSHESSTLLVQPLTRPAQSSSAFGNSAMTSCCRLRAFNKAVFPAQRMEAMAPDTCIMTEDTG